MVLDQSRKKEKFQYCLEESHYGHDYSIYFGIRSTKRLNLGLRHTRGHDKTANTSVYLS